MGAANLFVSYRRSDSASTTGRLRDRFIRVFGKRHVFIDVHDVHPAADYRVAVRESIDICDVMIVVIGPEWLTAANENGRRIDQPNDLVRIEIERGLERSVPLVPLLVEGATMPQPDDLPESIRELAYRGAASVRGDPDFHPDVDRLLARDPIESLPRPWYLHILNSTPLQLAIVAGMIAVAAIGLLVIRSSGDDDSESGTTVDTTLEPTSTDTPTSTSTGPTTTIPTRDRLGSNEYLDASGELRSPEGHILEMTDDGELQLISDGAEEWRPDGYEPTAGAVLFMQDDGNLAIFPGVDEIVAGRQLWVSGTGGNEGAALIVEDDDGEPLLEIRGSDDTVIWSTVDDTGQVPEETPPPPDTEGTPVVGVAANLTDGVCDSELDPQATVELTAIGLADATLAWTISDPSGNQITTSTAQPFVYTHDCATWGNTITVGLEATTPDGQVAPDSTTITFEDMRLDTSNSTTVPPTGDLSN